MPPLAKVEVPAEYLQQSNTLLRGILSTSHCESAFAQIYDGQETWSTAGGRGDVSALMEAEHSLAVSPDAERYAKAWLHKQDVGNIILQDWEARELKELFRSSYDARDRVVALAVCVFKPAIRWLIAQYCLNLQEGGRSLPSFGEQSRSIDKVEGLQGWAEEIVFGGELSLTEEYEVLTIGTLLSSSTNVLVIRITFAQTFVCT